MSDKKRVVVTGMGCITPIGNTVEELWNNLLAGKPGLETLPDDFFPDVESHSARVAGRVKNYDFKEYQSQTPNIKFVQWKKMDPFCRFGVSAAIDAAKNAKIDGDDIKKERVGVIIGSGIGGMQIFSDQRDAYNTRPKSVSPFFIPMLITNMVSGLVAINFKFRGPNFAVSSACASSNHAISAAFEFIKSGHADIMVTGGAEAAVTPFGLMGFQVMRAISERNDAPEKASRPFDVDRDGFVMAEGSGIVVIEELEHAKKRGATIYAEILGHGMSDDGHDVAQPCPGGEYAALAMKNAVDQCGLRVEEVDYINTHGTSTPQGDIAECDAVKKVFGSHVKNGLLISSTKSMTGHMLGAAGGVELIATVHALRNGVIPPTINVENQDPQCDLDVCANEKREADIKIALSNSFGFGGHNSALVVKKWSE